MLTLLNKIKPKRLSETLNGYVFKDKVVLDFGATKVVCFGDTGIRSSNPLCLSHKDLYNQELDNAIALDFTFNLPEVKASEVTFNVTDNSFFSAISGSGEDIYWYGSMNIDTNGFRVYGLNYKCEYSNFPMQSGHVPPLASPVLSIDYHVFYYLFQLTKHLNGKKTDTISFARLDDKLYITNIDRDYYVICDSENSVLKWKRSTLFEVDKIYFDKDISTKQVFKKVLNESASPLFKALSRPFGDVLNTEEKKNFNLYQDEKYKLWTLKNK